MELGQYVSDLQRQLVDAAENGTDDTRAVAERLAAGLDAATRLVLLDALSAAAGEITRDLAPGSVDMRLRGREVEFVVTQPSTEPDADDLPAPSVDLDDASTSRTTLRLPDALKVAGRRGGGRRRPVGQHLAGARGRGRPPTQSNDEPRSARCAPATTSRAGRASPHPQPQPATPTEQTTRPQKGRRQHAHFHHTHPHRPRHQPAGRRASRSSPSDRADTVVTVSPTNPAKAVDRRGAEETKVEFDGTRAHRSRARGRASASSARASRSTCRSSCRPGRGSPPRSRSAACAPSGASAPPASRRSAASTSTPPATSGCAPGTATRPSAPPTAALEITADHGQIRIGTVTRRRHPQGVARHRHDRRGRRRHRGEALLRRPRDHHGARARSRRRPRTAASQLDEVSSGSIQVESGYGQVDHRRAARRPRLARPRRRRTAACATSSTATALPTTSEQTVAVRARTQFGDITIRRAR